MRDLGEPEAALAVWDDLLARNRRRAVARDRARVMEALEERAYALVMLDRCSRRWGRVMSCSRALPLSAMGRLGGMRPGRWPPKPMRSNGTRTGSLSRGAKWSSGFGLPLPAGAAACPRVRLASSVGDRMRGVGCQAGGGRRTRTLALASCAWCALVAWRFRFETELFGRSRWSHAVAACGLAFIFIMTALIVRAAS